MVQLKKGHEVGDDELEDQGIPSLKGYSRSRSGESQYTGDETETTAVSGGDAISDSDKRAGGGSGFEGMPGDGDLSSRPEGSEEELDGPRSVGSTAGGTGQGGSTRSEGNR